MQTSAQTPIAIASSSSDRDIASVQVQPNGGVSERQSLVPLVCVLIALVLGMTLSVIYSADLAVYSASVYSLVHKQLLSSQVLASTYLNPASSAPELDSVESTKPSAPVPASSAATADPELPTAKPADAVVMSSYPACPGNVSLWMVGTASINAMNRNLPLRREQYARAVQSLIAAISQPALRAAFPDGCRHVVYTENNGGPSYLDELMSQARQNDSGTTWEVLYTRSNELSLEKGLKEMSDEFAFLKFAFARGMRDFDWVLKVTGRYRVTVPSSLIDLVVSDAAVPGRFDAAYRPGAYYQRNLPVSSYNKLDSVTGFFGMRAHAWRSFSEKYSVERIVRDEPQGPVEWFLARFVQGNVAQHRIQLMEYIGAEIAPGADQYFPVF